MNLYPRRGSARDGNVAAVGVELKRGMPGAAVGAEAGEIPAFVDDDIYPAEGFEIFRQPPRVGLYGVFVEGSAVGVPAIPAHWRPVGEDGFACGGLLGRGRGVREEDYSEK